MSARCTLQLHSSFLTLENLVNSEDCKVDNVYTSSILFFQSQNTFRPRYINHIAVHQIMKKLPEIWIFFKSRIITTTTNFALRLTGLFFRNYSRVGRIPKGNFWCWSCFYMPDDLPVAEPIASKH